VRVGREVAPKAVNGEGRLTIWIEDTGQGIPPEKRDELFTPFARLGAENGEIQGTGLGLALSQRLAKPTDGALRLGGSSDNENVFIVELERTSSPLAEIEESQPTRATVGIPAHRPATILYIEDNLANLSLVETILYERPNWRTISALQGQIGVELARGHDPDLILLDLHLPDTRGEGVLGRLRADLRTAEIPVIVISADATRAATERLLASGAVAFLHKPIDVQEFLDALGRLLPLPKSGE
jgi:CheY-like chemotaxis protein